MITEKDLLYLTDMFHWNMTAYKEIEHLSVYLEGNIYEDLCEDLKETHLRNCHLIMNILTGGVEDEE